MQRCHHSSSAPRALSIIPRTAALPILAALLLVGVIVWRLGHTENLLHTEAAEACSSLPGRAGQLCSSYYTAIGPDKFTAAVHWRKLSSDTYACSGITVECLQDDMHSSTRGSSCYPVQDGDACDGEEEEEQQKQQRRTCKQGFCGGRPQQIEPADPNHQPGISSGFAPVRFAAPQQQQQQQQQRSWHWLSRFKSLNASLLHTQAASTYAENVMQPRSLQAVPVSAAVDPKLPTAYGYVKFNDAGRRVPETFLATSHEWTRLTDYGGDNAQAWAAIFRMMSSSPVIRLGGASQDKLTEPPGDDTWIAMAQLQQLTNARFIIGLPLFPKNAVKMCRQMMSQAQKYLGSSVIGYELGNEPEFWPKGLGGWNATGHWKAGFGPYSKWFDKVARTLNPCGTTPFLSGPGWGNVNTQDPNWLRITLRNGKACGYLWESNTHYYPYIDNTTVTAEQLLSQDLQDFGLSKFKAYYNIAQYEHNLALRISEANSLYGGGRANLSDTMAGTLWVADALFAFANAGARAFHLHWGLGGQPFEGGAPNVGVQTNFDYSTPPPYVPYPSVHAPWFGYLFWVTASAGGYNQQSDTQFVAAWIDKNLPSTSAKTSAGSNVTLEAGSNSTAAASYDANKRVATDPKPPQQQKQKQQQGQLNKQQQNQKVVQERAAAPGKQPQGNKPAANSGKQAGNKGSTKDSAKKTAAKPGTNTNKGQSGKTQQQQKQQQKPLQQQKQKGRLLLDDKKDKKGGRSGGCDANIKLWALKAGDTTLRLAVINKDTKRTCNVKIMIPDAPQFCTMGQPAELSRLLPGSQGIDSKGGLSWQGQHYDDSSVALAGQLVDEKQVATVWATQDADGCAYVVGMPKASAALLVVQSFKR